MAKRMKSVQTDSSRDETLVAPAGKAETAADRNVQQRVSPPQSSSRTVIEDTDRAAAAIPDIVRAENDERERIAARAYELYLQRGGGHGRDTDDWLEAEREVGYRSDRPNDE
jgi:hypothetical protein